MEILMTQSKDERIEEAFKFYLEHQDNMTATEYFEFMQMSEMKRAIFMGQRNFTAGYKAAMSEMEKYKRWYDEMTHVRLKHGHCIVCGKLENLHREICQGCFQDQEAK